LAIVEHTDDAVGADRRVAERTQPAPESEPVVERKTFASDDAPVEQAAVVAVVVVLAERLAAASVASTAIV
jgi:hypothetical protein